MLRDLKNYLIAIYIRSALIGSQWDSLLLLIWIVMARLSTLDFSF